MTLAALIPLVGNVLDKLFPDKQAADAAKLRLLELQQQGELAELEAGLKAQLAGLENVKAEATGESWLQRNWRPITMLVFVALILAYWFGWVPPNLSEEAVLSVFDLLKIGLGGYVVGRSAEKIAREVGPALSRR